MQKKVKTGNMEALDRILEKIKITLSVSKKFDGENIKTEETVLSRKILKIYI